MGDGERDAGDHAADGPDDGDRCPHLDYRAEGDGRSFGTARAYCTKADRFVQPMRADICNARYGLDFETDCEIFRGDG